jgi:hypothetical protein
MGSTKYAEAFTKLEKASETYIVNINGSGNDSYDPKTRTVNWDPTSALAVQDDQGKRTGATQTPALGLGHELDHAAFGIQKRGLYGKHFGSAEEQRAVYNEQKSKLPLEGRRDNHYGESYVVPGPLNK